MNLSLLSEPFPAADVEWRVQSSGEKNGKFWARVLAYITNRAIMDRLDEVCGPDNWRNEYRFEAGGAVLCGISILVTRPSCADEFASRDEWVTKWDGAENTDIEAVKGGLSSAMKRAGYQWGIGRYLYRMEEGFAIVSEHGANYTKTKDGKSFKWDAPALPAWALPGAKTQPAPAARAPSPQVTRAASVADADRKVGGKRLGDYTSDELQEFVKKHKDDQGYVAMVKSARGVIADRSLGIAV